MNKKNSIIYVCAGPEKICEFTLPEVTTTTRKKGG